MKTGGCMRLCLLVVLLFNVCSCFLPVTIISSDTLNVEHENSNVFEASAENSHIHDVKSDKNSEEFIDVISSTATDDTISAQTETLADGEDSVYKDQLADQSIAENRFPNTPEPPTQPVDENSGVEPPSEENAAQTNDVLPDVPLSTHVVVEDTAKHILVDSPIGENIEYVLDAEKNDTVTTESPQVTDASNTSKLPTMETPTSSEATGERDETVENAARQLDAKHVPTQSDTVTTQDNRTESIESVVEIPPIESVVNLTVEENQIPVFSEWAQKRLEEVEKEVEQETVNISSMKKMPIANKIPVPKLKSAKNYASPDCGAKIVAANSESSGTGYVLTSTKDEYLLSPCKSRIWFVVELCEAIQAEHIDLANFELFSSSPKNFSVSVSNRFPTRDWSNVGRFIAKDERYIQSFDLHPHLFGKYVRVDIHSHYNSEHFCPISLFRVYGTSEFEAFETENRQHPIDDIDDDDEDDQEVDAAKGKSNIFKSASDAVMSIVDKVKKAAAFVKPNGNNDTTSNTENTSKLDSHGSNCVTPNFVINCENCSEEVANEVTALTQCKQQLLSKLLNIEIIRNSLYKSQICTTLIGQDLNINCSELISNSTTSNQLSDLQIEYITHLFSIKYITAMCNLLAAGDRKSPWNTYPFNGEAAVNVTLDKKDTKVEGDTKGKRATDHENLHSEHSNEGDTVYKSNQESAENQASSESLSDNENNGNSDNNKVITADTDEPKQIVSKENEVKTTTASATIDSHETDTEKVDQNIFNVIPTEPTEHESGEQKEIEETITPEPTNNNHFDQTIPSVIIVPETTTPTPTPAQENININDVIEDQTNGGWTNTPQFGQKLHSESVFLRLSNRVKALERNMSLSGQYLEELSRRYKKQVEDLQQSFAKTLINIEEQSRQNLERKQELFEQNQKLRSDLDYLQHNLFSWSNILICCVCFTCVQIIIFHIILTIWGKKYGLMPISSIDLDAIPKVDNKKRRSGNVTAKFRRKSAEEKRERNPSESSVAALQRRPSTEALNITGTYTELLIDDSESIRNIGPDYQIYDKENERKTKNNKNPSNERQEYDIGEYVRIEDLKQMYDKPSADYEFYGPAPELPSTDPHADGSFGSKSTLSSSIESTSPQPKKTKSAKSQQKNRRLSSPLFFKSPFSSSSTPQSTGWEWHRSKRSSKSSQFNNKKAKSESPDTLKQNGLNNNKNSPTSPGIVSKSVDERMRNYTGSTRSSSISSSFDGDRKQSGSFRRLLKKIF